MESGHIPDFQNLPKLETFYCNENNLTGNIPDFQNLVNLKAFLCFHNQLSGDIPDFSGNCPDLRNLDLEYNQFTFEDILPNLQSNEQLTNGNAIYSYDSLSYAPQDSIFTDTLITISEGEPLTIDLEIDEMLSSNQYFWFKDGQPYDTIMGDNNLTFENIALSDAGDYWVHVTNENAPELTLESYKISIQVESSTSTLQDCLEEIEENLPNGFTPDGDGINDLFDPLGNFASNGCLQSPGNARLTIISRWNEIVYEPDAYQPWDGRFSNGQLVPQGVYYYILRFELAEEVVLRKEVHVLRGKY